MDKTKIDNLINLKEDFIKLRIEKNSKLPHQINLIDELHANENAHSRIFLKILCFKENNRYPLFELFLNFLNDGFEKIKIVQPKFTAELDRIDVLIQDADYAIIVENKVNGAVDQHEQILRYINILENKGYNENGKIIYVLYLTKDGGSPSENSIPTKHRDSLGNRYREINFKDNILPWLENSVLPSCRLKDILLTSAVQQYIDHLHGLFHTRNIEKKMNEELKNYLTQKIEEKYSVVNLSSLSQIKEDIGSILYFVNEIQKDIFKKDIFEWFNKIKNKKNTEIITNITLEKIPDSYLFLGVKLKYKGVNFGCAIGLDNFSTKPYFGITIRDCSDKKFEIIEDLIKSTEFSTWASSSRWYIYQLCEIDTVFSKFENIVETFEKIINKEV